MRDHLANVRTFLARVQTAITTMAFGFAVANFGLLLGRLTGGTCVAPNYAYRLASVSLWFYWPAAPLHCQSWTLLPFGGKIERHALAFSARIPILLALTLIAVATGLAVCLAVTAERSLFKSCDTAGRIGRE
ncbi:MAG: DUF202 domain-containing protein [Chloroflexota bacterium]